jgi:hypothetical protein
MKKRVNHWEKGKIEIWRGIVFAIWLLSLAIVMNYVVGNYSNIRKGTVVQDLILDNIPTLNLGGLFIWGIFLFIAVLILYPLFFNVTYFPFVLAQLAFLLVIRNCFILLTNTQLPTDHLIINFPPIMNNWNFQNDLFFSGHVAIPFLGFLIFRKEKIKYFFLIGSILMAATVLLTKLHYSIDVFAAFFITYASFQLGKYFLKKRFFNIIPKLE